MTRSTFTVIYRTGGSARFSWVKALPVATRADADAQRAEIERAGYKALVFPTAQLNAIGLPETWETGDALPGSDDDSTGEPAPVESPAPVYTACVACSGALNTFQLGPDGSDGTLHQCQSCKALHAVTTREISETLVKPLWHRGPTDPSREYYFDITLLDGSERRHGWYNSETGCITQTG